MLPGGTTNTNLLAPPGKLSPKHEYKYKHKYKNKHKYKHKCKHNHKHKHNYKYKSQKYKSLKVKVTLPWAKHTVICIRDMKLYFSSLLAPTGALEVAPLPLFHITSSRSSKSLYNLLTLLKNLERLCLHI